MGLLLQLEIRLQIGHHVTKLGKVERLVAVAESLLRSRMHFDEQTIRADDYSSARKDWH